MKKIKVLDFLWLLCKIDYSSLKMETSGYSETLLFVYKTACCHIPGAVIIMHDSYAK
jgi:hypothetical protein